MPAKRPAHFETIFLSGDDNQSLLAKDGGARRDRTDDLKLAKLALSQLSYGPVVSNWSTRRVPAR